MILQFVLSLLALGDAPAKPAAKPEKPAERPAEKKASGVGKSSAPASEFHAEDYPKWPTKQVLKELPCAKGETAVKDALFSFEAVYQGASQTTPKARMAMIEEWTKTIGDPGAAVKYASQITVVEGAASWWMPVPEGLLTYMSMDMMPGDRFTAFVAFVGCVNGEPLFVVDEFEWLEQKDGEADDQLI